MPYRFRINGIDIECQTAEELQAAMKIKGFVSGAGHGGLRTFDDESRGKQGKGPKRSWLEAEEYAKKHGISRNEARSILAQRKKLAIEEALKNAEFPSPVPAQSKKKK